jgi:hypothetical protein
VAGRAASCLLLLSTPASPPAPQLLAADHLLPQETTQVTEIEGTQQQHAHGFMSEYQHTFCNIGWDCLQTSTSRASYARMQP